LKIAIIASPNIPVPPDQYGGIERIIYMLIQELNKKGHDITLFAHPDSKVDCKLIPYQESKKYTFKDFIKINLLTSKNKKFDLVHTFGRMNNIAFLIPKKTIKIVSYQLPPTVSQVKKAVLLANRNSLYFSACSNYIADQISKFCDITTVYNGVNSDEYQFNPKINDQAPLVFLGRIQCDKGTHLAIEVAKKTKNRLIIAGNIPNEKLHIDYFNSQVKPHLNNQDITYIGPVNNKEKNILLGNAKAFLMPVTWDEPFGIVMTEALACGTPVIGFKRGAIPEVVVDGYNGYVCENVEQMIIAVNHIKKINRENCRKVLEEKFSAQVIADQYERLYKRALKI